MNRKSLIMFFAISVLLLAGCNYPNSAMPDTNGDLYAVITTQVTSGGLVEPWQYAVVEGDEYDNDPPCQVGTDTSCLLDFSGVTGQLGTYSAYTDALPAGWNIGASDSLGYPTCPSGAAFNGTLTTDGITMGCGSNAVGNATISPASCTVGQPPNACPLTVTLTISDTTMPTSRAMSVNAYSSTAANISTNSETASSATVITAPTPTPSVFINGVASVVINVIDPSTNTVLASGVMTFYEPSTFHTCPTSSLERPNEAVTPNVVCYPS
jgi:hypothetical protein